MAKQEIDKLDATNILTLLNRGTFTITGNMSETITEIKRKLATYLEEPKDEGGDTKPKDVIGGDKTLPVKEG